MAKRLTPEQKLIKAEEDYLLASGWKRVKSKTGAGDLWSTNGRRVGYIFSGDLVYRDNALDAQKQAVDFLWR